MKKGTLLLYSIIIILTFIVVYQYVNIKKNFDGNPIIPFHLLNNLVEEKKENSFLSYYNKEKDKYELIDEVQYIQTLSKYCGEKNQTDSTNKYLKIASDYMPSLFKNNSLLCKNLHSDNKNQRMYSSKLIEYLILDEIIYTKEREFYQFDLIQVLLFSNTQFRNDTLNLGEDMECIISVGTNSFYNPIRIKIEGEDEIIMDKTLYERYIRKATVKGEDEIKGTVIYSLHGKDLSLDFCQKYWVK